MDTQAIIDEVARRHKVRLANDDPILSTITAIEVVHQLFADHLQTLVRDVANQATDRLAAQIETGRREIAAESDRARAAAAKLINDAGVWSSEKLREGSAAAASDILAATSAARETIQAEIASASRARRVATWAAVFTVCLGAAAFGGGLGFWLAGH